MSRDPQTIFSKFIQDPEFQIKNSESAEYDQHPNDAIQHLYEETIHKIDHFCIQVQLPKVQTTLNKFKFMASVIDTLLSQKVDDHRNESGIQCSDCQNYQTHLQKLENDVRQHIRLEHQLKLYQESLEEKIEEHRKDNERNITQIQQLKQMWEEQKQATTSRNDKLSKLEHQNQKLKQELFKVKSTNDFSHHNSHQAQNSVQKFMRETSQRKSIGKPRHENKENNGIKNRTYGKKEQRKSCEKRSESVERWRIANQTKSTKNFALSEKVLNQKSKQEKKRAIQSKFQARR